MPPKETSETEASSLIVRAQVEVRYDNFVDEDGHHHYHGDHHHAASAIDHGPMTALKLKDNSVLKRLKCATLLCCLFMVVEIVGGLLAGSLAVLSDAAHLMADLASFAVAIVAAYLAARPSTEHHTYGLKRTESLAALFSMTCLAIISVGLGGEAVHRIYNLLYLEETEDVDGKLMSGIATIGVMVNLVLAAVLGEHHVHMPGGDHGHDHSHDHGSCGGHHNSEQEATNDPFGNDPENGLFLESNEPTQTKTSQHNVNLRAAYLHVMADLAQSVAVLIAGLIIWAKPDWKIVDPIATILFCILVFYSTLGVIKSAICVLLEGTPPEVSWASVRDSMEMTPGVCNVHDLHIWSISHGITALSVHVQTTSTRVNSKQVLKTLASICHANGIQHTTIQIQPFCNLDNGCITCGLSDESQACVIGGECCREETYNVKTYCRKTSKNLPVSGMDAISETTGSTTSSTSPSPANSSACASGCCG